MNIDIEKERADFEAACRQHAKDAGYDDSERLERDGDGYADLHTQAAWWAWEARAAIEADRKRRGEPVAWAMFADNGNIRIWARKPISHPDCVPLYTAPQPDDFSAQLNRIDESMKAGARLTKHRLRLDAPQPAEPVGEVLGETCIDGGKCHHGCKERCFRRQCCEPFSDYSGPWEYAAETDAPQPAEPNRSDPAIGRLLDASHRAVELLDSIHDDPATARASSELSEAAAAINMQPAEPVKGARVATDPSLPELSIVWHDSPEGVDRAMWEEAAQDAGLSYEDLRDSVSVGQDENGAPVELTHAQTIDAIRNQGCWGFVDTNTGTIHAWAADDADPMLVVHMLAHEIGHMTGEQHPDELQEEMRAEQFGRVAAMAFRMWRQRRPLTIVEGAQ